MIVGIGIDTVDTNRFSGWHTYEEVRLKKILSPEEIAYCKSNSHLSAQRFAVRFAAREAFFKAWVSAFPDHYIPFLTLCRAITVIRGPHNEPKITINWPFLGFKQPHASALLSLSHTSTTASAIIFIQKNSI